MTGRLLRHKRVGAHEDINASAAAAHMGAITINDSVDQPERHFISPLRTD